MVEYGLEILFVHRNQEKKHSIERGAESLAGRAKSGSGKFSNGTEQKRIMHGLDGHETFDGFVFVFFLLWYRKSSTTCRIIYRRLRVL